MAQHTNYWTCSKFADWIRGTDKPVSATMEDWDEWNTSARKAHPVRYWVADDGLDYLQDFVTWPIRKIYDLKYYINNRWVSRTNALVAHPRDIAPGSWRDVGDRFLPCLFNSLVDFVEIELAWMQVAWSDESKERYKAPFWSSGWFRWRTWRNKRAGLDNLGWQMNLTWGDDELLDKDDPRYGKPTSQAIKAREIYELYFWWTVICPGRSDPYEASGWTAVCEKAREMNGGKLTFRTPPELKKEHDRAHKALTKMEAAYEKEDEEMLIRLIKVRHGLWT